LNRFTTLNSLKEVKKQAELVEVFCGKRVVAKLLN